MKQHKEEKYEEARKERQNERKKEEEKKNKTPALKQCLGNINAGYVCRFFSLSLSSHFSLSLWWMVWLLLFLLFLLLWSGLCVVCKYFTAMRFCLIFHSPSQFQWLNGSSKALCEHVALISQTQYRIVARVLTPAHTHTHTQCAYTFTHSFDSEYIVCGSL